MYVCILVHVHVYSGNDLAALCTVATQNWHSNVHVHALRNMHVHVESKITYSLVLQRHET